MSDLKVRVEKALFTLYPSYSDSNDHFKGPNKFIRALTLGNMRPF